MGLGRGAPGRAGVVDQDVDRAQPLQRLGADPARLVGLAASAAIQRASMPRWFRWAMASSRSAACASSACLGTGVTQRLGDLQAQAA